MRKTLIGLLLAFAVSAQAQSVWLQVKIPFGAYTAGQIISDPTTVQSLLATYGAGYFNAVAPGSSPGPLPAAPQLTLQQWTTATRPTDAPNGTLGMNTTLNAPEAMIGGVWTQIVPASGSNVSVDLGTGALKLHGQNGLSAGTDLDSPWVAAGPFAGASIPTTGLWLTAFGAHAAQNFVDANNEVSAFGDDSCWQLVHGAANVCVGEHAGGSEMSVNNYTALGSDNSRNTIGCVGCSAVGAWANRNGTGNQDTVNGAFALEANGSSVTIGGSVTIGDVITLTFTTAASSGFNLTGFPATISYTVGSGDTLNSIAQNIATKIMSAGMNGGDTAVQAWVSNFAGAPAPPPVIGIDFPGDSNTGYAISITYGLSTHATETVTVGTGFTGSNMDVSGYGAVQGLGITNATNLTVHGAFAMPYTTSASSGVCEGAWCGYNTSASSNFVIVGDSAGYNWNGIYGAVFVGDHAGYGATTGLANTILGDEDGQANGGGTASAQGCITSGNYNLELGFDACVTSATGGGQLSIQNIIFGIANTALGMGSVSTGQIGIGQRSPLARFDILGAGTGAELVFRAQNSTGSFAIAASDSGVVTFTGLATGAAATYACFTSGGQLISSLTACP